MSIIVRAAVFGASGYAGAELLRLAWAHPGVEVVAAGARSHAGRAVGELWPHLSCYGDLRLEELAADDVAGRADVAFLALPHGESATLAPSLVEAGVRVVDLSGDFRLDAESYPLWYGFEHPARAWLEKAAYGLPELFADRIRGADLVANPGCYPTAVLLALAPLLRAGAVEAEGVVIDAKSGISGAGRTPTDATHFAASDGSVRPYRAGGAHQHTPEIERGLAAAAGVDASVTFVPHLVPATRGILATCYARLRVREREARAALAAAYAGAPFVRVLPDGELPDTKRVAGSNHVEVGLAVDERTQTAVAVAALDNLVKGAAGQAIQNLNLMAGFDEEAGLDAPPVYP